ncbi:MAG: ClpXP protease specificity-enhancing factor SspB [Polyangiaceae bacterium]
MPDELRLPPKKDVVLALLEQSDVFVHLDPRKDEVRVPQWFKKQPHLVLQIGLNMPVPIRDLEVNDDSISCTLSFNRSPFFCFLPWSAIYALVGSDGRAMVWPDDVPPEVAAQAAKQAAATMERSRQRAHLRAVSEPSDDEADKPSTEPSEAPAPPPTPIAASEGISEDAPRPSVTPDASSPRASTPSEPPAGKGKKPLPPWLRVVK